VTISQTFKGFGFDLGMCIGMVFWKALQVGLPEKASVFELWRGGG
jgi:hypothetical protein